MVMEGRGWGGRVRGVGDSGRDREEVAEDIMHPGGRWVCITKSGIRYIKEVRWALKGDRGPTICFNSTILFPSLHSPFPRKEHRNYYNQPDEENMYASLQEVTS